MTATAPPDRQSRPVARSGLMQVRLSPQLRDAISDAATARGMTASAWVRHAAMTVAMLEGVLFPDVRTDGKRRYARIEGGAIVDVQYLADQPAQSALPNWSDPMSSTDSRSAGALYDRVEGRQRWARIEGDQIKGIGYHDAKPDDGNVYVSVVHEDSEPFVLATHWRLAPRYTLVDVAGVPDRVICTYPVVVKSLEHA
jgi:hypothetical protein